MPNCELLSLLSVFKQQVFDRNSYSEFVDTITRVLHNTHHTTDFYLLVLIKRE